MRVLKRITKLDYAPEQAGVQKGSGGALGIASRSELKAVVGDDAESQFT